VKGGSRYLAEQKVDPDKLRDWLKSEKFVDTWAEATTLATRLLRECLSE
jgi:hypothetical protein